MTSAATRLPLLLGALAAISFLWGLSYCFIDFQTAIGWINRARDSAAEHPWFLAGIVVSLQALSMLLSLPTKAMVNIAAGALLGLWAGTGLTLLGVIAGTSGLFWAVRRYGRNGLPFKVPATVENLEERLARRPVLSTAALRMMVLLPYGPITIACALTPISYRHFAIGSIIGDLPVVFLYSIAGARLMTLSSATDAIPTSTIIILMSAGALLLSSILIPPRSGLRSAQSESEP
jgi:uncharacterized membrane protein YdjX (TVP38/TMEM64 family)